MTRPGGMREAINSLGQPTSYQHFTPTYATLATILQQGQTLADRHLQTSDQELTPANTTLPTILQKQMRFPFPC